VIRRRTNFLLAVLSPARFGLVELGVDVNDDKTISRALTLIVKLSQLVVNGSIDKEQIAEQCLHPLVPALKKFAEPYHEFAVWLCTRPDEGTSERERGPVLSQEAKLKLMAIVIHHTKREWVALRAQSPSAAGPVLDDLGEMLGISRPRHSDSDGGV
jgi:hypothetical protein